MITKRIFMNEEDGSPSGGGAPPAPAQPPATPAAAPAPTVPVDQIKTLITETFGELRNGLFADLRKAGALGKDKPPETPPPATPAPAAAAAPTGISATDVKLMIERDRALTRSEIEHKLTPAQRRRMESALEADKPEDVSEWAKTYLADMGLAKVEPTQPVTPPVGTAPRPASDKGSPAPPVGVLDYERELVENPIGMSDAAYSLLVAKHGSAKAWQMRSELARKQAERVKVTIPKG